jgi:hypothetical protein
VLAERHRRAAYEARNGVMATPNALTRNEVRRPARPTARDSDENAAAERLRSSGSVQAVGVN